MNAEVGGVYLKGGWAGGRQRASVMVASVGQ